VEVLGGVEPEPELLLAVADAVDEYVGVQRVRLAGDVSQELQVDLVVVLRRHKVRRQLQQQRPTQPSSGECCRRRRGVTAPYVTRDMTRWRPRNSRRLW
jgi:hypothetical protein